MDNCFQILYLKNARVSYLTNRCFSAKRNKKVYKNPKNAKKKFLGFPLVYTVFYAWVYKHSNNNTFQEFSKKRCRCGI